MSSDSIEKAEEDIKLFEKYKNFLTQNQIQVFILHRYEDLSFSEIAEILATTRSSAHDTFKKAVNKLEKIDAKFNS